MRLRLALKHPAGRRLPIMVALVTRGADGSPVAVHGTFPARDSLGKATILWALFDPNTAPLRGLPAGTATPFIPTSNGHVLASAIVMPHVFNGPPR